MLLAFTLGPAEIAVLALLALIPLSICFFIYRAGKNAGRAEAMKEQLDRVRQGPPIS